MWRGENKYEEEEEEEEARKGRSQRQDGGVEMGETRMPVRLESVIDRWAFLFVSLSSYSSFTYAKKIKKKERKEKVASETHCVNGIG